MRRHDLSLSTCAPKATCLRCVGAGSAAHEHYLRCWPRSLLHDCHGQTDANALGKRASVESIMSASALVQQNDGRTDGAALGHADDSSAQPWRA